MAEAYELNLPPYPGSQQFVELAEAARPSVGPNL